MWVVALVGSVLLLAFCLGGGRSRETWWLPALGQMVALICPGFLFMVLPPVMIQSGIGLVALPLLALPRRGPRCYQWACVAAFVAGWVSAGVDAVQSSREYARLRTVYPFEPVADRLPTREPVIPPLFEERELDRAEGMYDQRIMQTDRPWIASRTRLLRRLHEQQTELFTDAAGFGVGRMGVLSEKPTAARLAEDEPPERESNPSFLQMVRGNVFEFADPANWGYRRGNEVAGFLPHALRRPPGPAMGWAVERVELVGLLLAPDPRVYVSESLPRMTDLADAVTRHPDGFESPALARLRAGEELVFDGSLGRLFGAVRAAKQCLQCHGGDRGELLGAFSYRLRPQ